MFEAIQARSGLRPAIRRLEGTPLRLEALGQLAADDLVPAIRLRGTRPEGLVAQLLGDLHRAAGRLDAGLDLAGRR